MQSPVPIPGNAQWRKSTWSDQGEACVEVWRGPRLAAVRDSKNPAGPMLPLPPSTLTAFLNAIVE